MAVAGTVPAPPRRGPRREPLLRREDGERGALHGVACDPPPTGRPSSPCPGPTTARTARWFSTPPDGAASSLGQPRTRASTRGCTRGACARTARALSTGPRRAKGLPEGPSRRREVNRSPEAKVPGKRWSVTVGGHTELSGNDDGPLGGSGGAAILAATALPNSDDVVGTAVAPGRGLTLSLGGKGLRFVGAALSAKEKFDPVVGLLKLGHPAGKVVQGDVTEIRKAAADPLRVLGPWRESGSGRHTGSATAPGPKGPRRARPGLVATDERWRIAASGGARERSAPECGGPLTHHISLCTRPTRSPSRRTRWPAAIFSSPPTARGTGAGARSDRSAASWRTLPPPADLQEGDACRKPGLVRTCPSASGADPHQGSVPGPMGDRQDPVLLDAVDRRSGWRARSVAGRYCGLKTTTSFMS